MAHLQEVTTADFDAEVIQSPLPVLVDFWAPWCQPCLIVAPAVEKLAEEYAGRIKVVKCNLSDNIELAERFGIRGIPVLFFFKNGEVYGHLLGAHPEQTIAQAIETVLQDDES